MRSLALVCWLCLSLFPPSRAEDGYRLWLRYDPVTNPERLNEYRQWIKNWMLDGQSPTLEAAGHELRSGLEGMLNQRIPQVRDLAEGATVLCVNARSPRLSSTRFSEQFLATANSFAIRSTVIHGKKVILVAGNDDLGILYGVFYFLKLIQTNQPIDHLSVESIPRVKIRILNHWDNLDRTVERGYAGGSLWDWHRLPEYVDERYRDYARANASIGINAAAITNVNANALALTAPYLAKAAALAKVFRPYGVRIFLTARFSAPMEAGGLKTADPLNADVRNWWTNKVAEIYQYIPDFGGFLVKANSEGQPGPQNYGRTHADGANMLGEALMPYKGVVMWRAFVYDNNVPDDRAKQAYSEFKPLDGAFRENVLIQVKNGPVDFQPREPFHPLFGAMPRTPLMMEFQITQEYLGFATHLVFLAPLFKECLDSDTFANGEGSTVMKVVDGSLNGHSLSGIAGVANIGSDRNWCGHLFGQANWYAFGRLAWNPQLSASQIADEWIRMTFGNNEDLIGRIKPMMLQSREMVVNYMTPLGLHHIMGANHHYGPAPWIKAMPRADWTSVYYHRADSAGIGFDRSTTGSNAVGQYFLPAQKKFATIAQCPEKFLLWFHHVRWEQRLASGRPLWEELCHRYYRGVDSVRWMKETWRSVEGMIDAERFNHVSMLLDRQEKEAVMWRNACVLYFQTFSRKPIPPGLERPDKDLAYYQKMEFPYAPGIRPRW